MTGPDDRAAPRPRRGRHRPYDWSTEDDAAVLERFLGRARAFVEACKAVGWHLGIAVGNGPVECPTCGTPWPCAHQRQVEKAFRERPR